ncbi:ScbR family autoregulator-binding transcription factor [Streptomyces daliensis]|uniref:TetR/AcrR family transcriptional regulator n=1 Tax=Streptomyces daliensis TaxID=299421 RepID=A0A8T4IYI3_9ACTN|nr:TetR/AcrR family transcriptional regulator [Streptomyces daliensis]
MQQRAIETRQMILEAAAEVFDRDGYSGATIAKIHQRAGVTQGALTFHFRTKLDLAHEVMNAQKNHFSLPPGEDGLQRLIDTTLLLAQELQTNMLLRVGVRLAVDQELIGIHDPTPYQMWVDEFKGQLSAAAARGELREHVDVEELAELLVGIYTGIQLFSQSASRRADLPERLVSFWRYCMGGFVPPHVQAEMTVDADQFTAAV